MGFIDSETLNVLVGILTAMGSVVPAILLTRQTKKIDREWREVGRRRGLEYGKSKGRVRRSLHGEIDEIAVSVEERKKRRGKGKGMFTRFELEYSHSGPVFELSRKQPSVADPPADQPEPIPVGDADFDRRLRLTGEDPREIVRFLTPERRARVLRLLMRYPSGVVRDGAIELQQRTAVETGAQIDEILENMLGLARLLVSAEDGDVAPPHVRIGGEPTVLEAEPAPAPARELEPDLEPELPPPPAPEPPAVVAPDPPLPVEEVGAALFTESRMGSETERMFARRFRDLPVRGTGMLVRIDGHCHLPDLGHDSARQVVLELPDPASPGRSGRPVRVLIPVPEEVAAPLRAHVGEEFAFEGRLVACNPYLRDLHLEGSVRST